MYTGGESCGDGDERKGHLSVASAHERFSMYVSQPETCEYDFQLRLL